MTNKTRNAIAGLAMLVGTALGQGVTNRPVISKVEVENPTTSNTTVRVYATNFDSDLYKNFQLQASTNLLDWSKIGLSYPVQSNLTNEVLKTVKYAQGSPYFKRTFYRIKCEDK